MSISHNVPINLSHPMRFPINSYESQENLGFGESADFERELNLLANKLEYAQRFPDVIQEVWMKEITGQLKNAIQRKSCFWFGDLQMRILLFKQMLAHSQLLPFSEELILLLNQYIIHMEETARRLYRKSNTYFQGNLWPLYERIMCLPSLTPDYFGAAIVTINEKLSSIRQSIHADELKKILPELLPPSHYLWNQDRMLGLDKLEEIKQKVSILLDHFNYTYEVEFKELCYCLEIICNTYQNYIEKFHSIPEKKQRKFSIPKVQLTGVGLGFFNLDQKVARRILSRNNQGVVCKKNQFGSHAVHYEEGVYYKPNSQGRSYIGPEMEFAIDCLYQLLGSTSGVAPTLLGKANYLYFENQNKYSECVFQAGYGVDGILLQELLGMCDLIPYLERSLGENNAKTAFEQLLRLNLESEFLNMHPDLSEEKFKIDSLGDLSEELLVEIRDLLLEKFVEFSRDLPPKKRIIEFSDLQDLEKTKRDFYEHIKNRSTRWLVYALALLQCFPDLCISKRKEGERQVSFTEITDFCFYLEKSKKNFPDLSPENLYQELSTILDRFDLTDFSTHFVVSLLTNPFDHKSDNWMVSIQKNEEGGVKSLSLVGIDNDLAFASSEERVSTMIYLLKPMAREFDAGVRRRLIEATPEGLLIDWLIALEEQNIRYEKLQKQKILNKKVLFEDGEPAIRIPFKIERKSVFDLYEKARKLIAIIKENPNITHREILHEIQPRLADACEKVLSVADSCEIAYKRITNYLLITDKKESMHKESILNIVELLLPILITNIGHSLKVDVKIFGKIMHLFPALRNKIPYDFNDLSYRSDFFLLAVQKGYYDLVDFLLSTEEWERSRNVKRMRSSLIKVKNSEERTALMIACMQPDLEMIKLLLSYGANPEHLDFGKRSVIALCLNRFLEFPSQSIAAIKVLGDQSEFLIPWNAASLHRGLTPLHHLITMADSAPEEVEFLVSYLIQKGSSADIIESKGKTALDYAMERENERLVMQLIKLGAGSILDVTIAEKFFNCRLHFEEAYEILKNRSTYLRWHLALKALQKTSCHSQITLEGVQLGKIGLSSDMIKELLNEKGDILNKENYGRRNVVKLVLQGGHVLYFKQYPEMPGMEYAVDLLFELMIGHGASFSDLAKITLPNGKNYPVLISQGIKGDNLHDVLKKHSEKLKELDSLAFSELLMTSLLVNFEDAKPDNFILEPLSEGGYRLVGIDNDRAFVPPLIRDGQKTVQVKCILYCLDIMKASLHPSAIERFLSFDPERFLRSWLNQLSSHNERYCALFSKKERIWLYKHKNIVVPIPFKSRVIADFYQKFHRLQKALREDRKITGIELLRQVIPSLGIRYEKTFNMHNTPLERFASLIDLHYTKATEGFCKTMITGREILQSMGITKKKVWESVTIGGPKSALKELESLQKEINATMGDRIKIRNALQNGNLDPFNELYLDTEKEKIINGIPGVFKGINFNNMRKKGEIDVEKQKKILETIIVGHYGALRILGCAVLNEEYLSRLIRNSPQLLFLELRNCIQLDQNIIKVLAQATHLIELRLTSLTLKGEINVPHPTLRRLRVNNCRKIERLFVSHTLKSLYVKDCENLVEISPRQHKIIPLLGSIMRKRPLKNFIIEKLYLEGCPKLETWGIIFEDWLKQSPKNIIKFENVPLDLNEDNLHFLFWQIIKSPNAQPLADSFFYYFFEKFETAFTYVMEHDKNNMDAYELFVNYYHNDLKKLIHLDLSQFGSTDNPKRQLNDLELLILAKACPNLTSINLYDCHKLTYEGLIEMTELLPHLTSINLGGNLGVGAGADPVSDSEINKLTTIVSRFHKLTSVDFSYKAIKDADLIELASKCPELINVNFKGCRDITDLGLIALARECPKLTSVNIMECNNITNESLCELARICTNLTSLHCDQKGLTDDVLLALGAHCLNLTTLTFSHNEAITNEGFIGLSHGCCNLTSIDFSFNKTITDDGIFEFARNCQNLISINFNNCNLITEKSLNELVKANRNLVSICVASNENVTKKFLETVGENCVELKSLNLEECSKITNTGLLALAKKNIQLKNLIWINLTSNENITDEGLILFAKAYPNLQFVNIAKCQKITRMGLLELAKTCTNLYSISFYGCSYPQSNRVLTLLTQSSSNFRSIRLQNFGKIRSEYSYPVLGEVIDLLRESCPKLKYINEYDENGNWIF